jgi:hypothetical protein
LAEAIVSLFVLEMASAVKTRSRAMISMAMTIAEPFSLENFSETVFFDRDAFMQYPRN